ncbi:DNA gyrase inhibitor YacG [Sphingomicrobium clamense]|uniref:DNA gyrase inhibitor YacG n=1 Tax=Sphingomicrobium clamense TaxID=2851013 RepID=A0ABS6V3M3_9SPHN|nr:DNA gyrase inhibitor YacG [Sphingomicrobium sp. B8]MBW0144151.1 DNA gyrase inhibitor YacG [Sphingomicrobium sp. B8]
MPKKPDSKCPDCGKPTAPEYRPFCSRGCKDRDLLNWLDEGYRIPGPAAALDNSERDENLGD